MLLIRKYPFLNLIVFLKGKLETLSQFLLILGLFCLVGMYLESKVAYLRSGRRPLRYNIKAVIPSRKS